MSKWIARELGPDVPLHFSAFHPDYKLTEVASARRRRRSPARARSRSSEGLRYVYTGNVHDRDGGTTFCPGCASPLIVRDWHQIVGYALTPEGRCPHCATMLPGRYERFERAWGNRRQRVRVPPVEPSPAAE